ncbi:MAG: hypothetical protein ACRDJ9_28425 [Dehalococcoidia bacterium]
MTVDRQAGVIFATTSEGHEMVLDVTAARAMWIVIQEAVYQQRSLRPDGPTLTLTYDRGIGRAVTVRQDG